jgi:hypothetical protein
MRYYQLMWIYFIRELGTDSALLQHRAGTNALTDETQSVISVLHIISASPYLFTPHSLNSYQFWNFLR